MAAGRSLINASKGALELEPCLSVQSEGQLPVSRPPPLVSPRRTPPHTKGRSGWSGRSLMILP